MKIINVPNLFRANAIPQGNQTVTQNCQWQSGKIAKQTLAFINQKGGVGKSSSCFHLAGAYSALGLRVLVVDADPQASISQGFFGSEIIEELPQDSTIAELFDERFGLVNWNNLVVPTAFKGIDICRANQYLAKFNHPVPEESGMGQFALKEFIDSQDGYDIVLIDCPPNLYRCTWSALVAADWVVIPVNPEDFGTQGLRAVHEAIENARVLNSGLRRLGHLVTRSDGRLVIHRFYERRLRKKYGNLVLDSFLSELAAFKMAVAERSPVQFHAPKSRAASLTRNLSREILDRTDVKNTKRRAA